LGTGRRRLYELAGVYNSYSIVNGQLQLGLDPVYSPELLAGNVAKYNERMKKEGGQTVSAEYIEEMLKGDYTHYSFDDEIINNFVKGSRNW
jgi:hypothetical protein